MRAPVLLVFLWMLRGYAADPMYSSIFDGVNLGFHEAGHAAFMWFGNRMLTTAGGTIFQLGIQWSWGSTCSSSRVTRSVRRYASSGSAPHSWALGCTQPTLVPRRSARVTVRTRRRLQPRLDGDVDEVRQAVPRRAHRCVPKKQRSDRNGHIDRFRCLAPLANDHGQEKRPLGSTPRGPQSFCQLVPEEGLEPPTRGL